MMPKMKMRMKKFGRMTSIFEFCHIKIRLYDNFHENPRKKIDPFFKTFQTNRGKNKNVNEKIWENEFDL